MLSWIYSCIDEIVLGIPNKNMKVMKRNEGQIFTFMRRGMAFMKVMKRFPYIWYGNIIIIYVPSYLHNDSSKPIYLINPNKTYSYSPLL